MMKFSRRLKIFCSDVESRVGNLKKAVNAKNSAGSLHSVANWNVDSVVKTIPEEVGIAGRFTQKLFGNVSLFRKREKGIARIVRELRKP